MGSEGRADKQRRPKGQLWLVTDDLVERLEKLIGGGVQQKDIAARLSKRMGYEVDPSTISNIVQRKFPSSVFAGPLAVEFGWPTPPPVVSDERMRKITEIYAKLLLIDPKRSESVDEFAEAELANAERKAKASRGNPEE